MHEGNRKGIQQENLLLGHLLIHFLTTKVPQREILKSVKQAVLGLLLPPFVHILLPLLTMSFSQTLRCPHLNSGSYHFLGTCYESSPDLINS